MICDYIFKIVVLGSPSVGKTSFLRYNSSCVSNSTMSANSIGVTFHNVQYNLDNELKIKFQLWDIKASSKFIYQYPKYCEGAKGYILCFDISNKDSFNQLPNWIKIIRLSKGMNIPIILIGMKSDLNHEVSEMEIEKLINDYELDGFFLTSINLNLNRSIIFKYLGKLIFNSQHTPTEHLNSFMLKKRILIELKYLGSLIGKGNISNNEDFTFLPPEERDEILKFLKFYSNCPICKKSNHKNYLKKIYIDSNPEKVRFKEKLITLINDSEDFDDIFYNKITLGIPCCDCYKNIFGEIKN